MAKLSCPSKKAKNDSVAACVVNSILDSGLAKSTWRDAHAEAYDDLLKYREDMIVDAEKTLKKASRAQRKGR
jgi:cellobiose-specific phosphotransferase system component IIA